MENSIREQKVDAREMPLMVDQLLTDFLMKRLENLMQRQFFELSKYLLNLYSSISLERVLKKQAVSAEFKKRQDEASKRGMNAKQLEDGCSKGTS